MLELVQSITIGVLAVVTIVQGLTQRNIIRAIGSLTQAISRRQP